MNKKNYLFAILTVTVWSTMAAVVKSLLSDIPDLEALSVSSAFAFLFLLAVNAVTGRLRAVRRYGARQFLVMAGLGFVGLFMYSALYYRGIAVLSSQEACILNYLWPVMLVIFSSFILKEKMTWIKGLALLCSFTGVVILSGFPAADAGGDRWIGIACCLAAAACYGLFSVLNKKLGYDQNITMTVIWFTVAAASAALGLCTERWVPIEGMQWAGILWLGIAVDAIAYLLWALALSDAGNTAVIANLAYMTPFLSIAVSAVFLNETIQPVAVIAAVFIIGGILIQSIFGHEKKKLDGPVHPDGPADIQTDSNGGQDEKDRT